MSPVLFIAITYCNIGCEFHSIITTLNLHTKPLFFNELYSDLVAYEILLNSALDHPFANVTYKLKD